MSKGEKDRQVRLTRAMNHLKIALNNCASLEEFTDIYKKVLSKTKHGKPAKSNDLIALGQDIQQIQDMWENAVCTFHGRASALDQYRV